MYAGRTLLSPVIPAYCTLPCVGKEIHDFEHFEINIFRRTSAFYGGCQNKSVNNDLDGNSYENTWQNNKTIKSGNLREV